MKILHTCLFLILTNHAYSQTFLPFQKHRATYYNFTETEALYYRQAGISIDSFKIIGSDTIFYHYAVMDWDNSNGCSLKIADTLFTGAESIRTTINGDEFFNRFGDTVFFRNTIVLNDAWTMFKLFGGNKITATVVSITSEPVLGIADTIETISLQAEDDSGNPISNLFNGKTFRIGKSTGLIQGYSLFHFPFDTLFFSLAGIENPSLGLSVANLTPQKIFDFDPGDRFDFIKGSVTEPAYHFIEYRTKKIISKEISLNGDTITYLVNAKYLDQMQYANDYFETSGESNDYEKYILSENNFLNVKPGQWANFISSNEGGPMKLDSSIYLSGATVKNFFDNYLNFNDTCLTDVVWGVGPGNVRYASQLGKVYNYYGDFSTNNSDELVYYNKSDQEWGDSIEWNGLNIETLPQQEGLSIFPNPADKKIFVSIPASHSPAQLILLNSFGEKIKFNETSPSEGSHLFDISFLSEGIYFLQIMQDGIIKNLKFIKN